MTYALDELPTNFQQAPGMERLALDRAISTRTIDADGRMHVIRNNISKACVNEYLGREIPAYDELGLEANRRYRLWRHPDELKKAVATFHRIPVLDLHKPIDARDHKHKLVVGTTGSDATFEAPYLKSSIAFWTQEAINDIDADERKELSSAYRYRADMTPGVTPEGERYDGIMRDIVGNHVALVKQGRAGPDVVVGDSMENLMAAKSIKMTRRGYAACAVLATYIRPVLAADAALDLRPILAKLNTKNFGAVKGKVIDAIKPKLAQDAKAADIVSLVDALEKNDMVDGDEEIDVPVQPEISDPVTETMDAEGGGIKDFLKGKLSEEDYAAACKMLGGTSEDADPDKDDAEKKDDDESAEDNDPDKEDGEEKPMSKKAMDEAIASAVAAERANNKAIREAEEFVRPWAGRVIAQDSALGVYQAALEIVGVKDAKKIDSIHACRAVLESRPKAGEKAPAAKKDPAVAMDAAQAADFTKRFPGAAHISVG